MKAGEFKALGAIAQIRLLSGMFDAEDKEGMVQRLALICLITRAEQGDAEKSFLETIIDQSFPS